jgi:Protein of unknown function (DUF1153)
MGQYQLAFPMAIAGSLNEKSPIDMLPPPRNRRWVRRQKRAVVAAVYNGSLPLSVAMERYEMSIEEFVSWECEFLDEHAAEGLAVN